MPASRPLIDPSLSRINNFGIARLLLAALVVFSHAYKLSGEGIDPLTRLMRNEIEAGRIAVSLFFAISGFLVTKSWQNCKTTWEYLRKRASRIYPAYLVTVAVCGLVVVPLAARPSIHWASYLPRLIARTPAFAPPFYDPSFFSSNPESGIINGSLWSLRYEFLCYLTVLLVGVIALKVHRSASVLVAIGANVAFAFVRNRPVPTWHAINVVFGELGTWPCLLAFFFAGMSLHFYSDVVPRRLIYVLLGVATLIAATYAGWLDITLPLVGTYLIFFLIFTRSRLNRVGRSVDLSFGIYLHSFWIQQVLVAVFPAAFLHMPLRLFVCGLALSAGVAFLSWTFVEEPAQRRMKTGLATKHSAAPPS